MRDELGEPRFRSVQLWQWLWRKMARDFEGMSDISRATRARLAEAARIRWPEVAQRQESGDGTVKFLLRMEDGALVESVLIPSESRDGNRRWSQCLSSQVGCAMACTFCATGSMGFQRNLS
ncbi:MAG: 23S rRNA (adenine(2503)-C(2))-methyltransferase RlmN, partial [Desulfovibrio sp.]|nr:23S rRNA (adenine(2503)-C(2))-methyltransferase RlmN [Desulfovibrio sp.]